MRHVFVYGTLRRGEVNDINALEPKPDFIGLAAVDGSLYPMGWYPGLTLGGPGRVVGEVYAVSPELEARLDEIEGLLPEPSGEYIKQDVALQVGGQSITCFVYEIAPALISHLVPMAEGDWLKRPSA
ncbi:gamma-glutamylcyclotransferase [Xylophilus sp. Kf1]|nr:gamma-glutamylcyclotransferase [Xylophilus sp. Kf1]